jgi:Zn finger protein HypA/HybF involved in hydrogenase expression
MHEAGLVREVLIIAQEAAEAEGLTRITSIELIIGDKLCVMPESLEFAFHYMKSGQLLEDAELKWEICAGREFTITYIEGD